MIKRPRTPQKSSQSNGKDKSTSRDEDFYANMAIISDDETESKISEVDVDQLANLDDMDADLFGGRKKNSDKKLLKKTSPRRTAGTPRSLSPPSRTGTPTSKGQSYKSPAVEEIDLTGLLTDDESHLSPKEKEGNSTKKNTADEFSETKLPSPHKNVFTATKTSQKTTPPSPPNNSTLTRKSIADDDIDLSGLLSEDDSLLLPKEKKETPSKSVTSSAVKPTLPDKVSSPTKSSTNETAKNTNTSKTKEIKEAPVKKAVTFSNEDDIFNGLGLDESALETSRPSRSALDDLFGKSSPTPPFTNNKGGKSLAASLLMDKPTNDDLMETEREDYMFGSYVPSAASQPTTTQTPGKSVRFQNQAETNPSRPSSSQRRGTATAALTSFHGDSDSDFDWLVGADEKSKSSKVKEQSKMEEEEDSDDWLGVKTSKKTMLPDPALKDDFEDELAAGFSLPQKSGSSRKRGSQLQKQDSLSSPVKEKVKITSTPKSSLQPKEPSDQVVKKTEDVIEKDSSPVRNIQKMPPLTKLTEQPVVTTPSLPPQDGDQNKPEQSPKSNQIQDAQQLLQQLQMLGLQPSINQNFPTQTSKLTIPNGPHLNVPHTPQLGISQSPQYMQSIPANITDGSFDLLIEAQIKIRRLEIEKEQLSILNESMKKRCSEEIAAIEESYKSRLQLLADTHQHKEIRCKEENEQFLKQNIERLRQLEVEKSAVIQRHYTAMETFEQQKSAEFQQLKEAHYLAMQQERKDFAETVNRLKETKLQELETIGNFQSTNKSLNIVMEQIKMNAEDLGHFQQKLDTWQNQGMDEREISIRARDEQLTILQERLGRQQEENGRERARLEELIQRLESQLHNQTQLLDDERWKVKQEVNRFHVLQVSAEAEKRNWEEYQAREKAAMDKSRNALLEEQKMLMTQLLEERRALAEEKVHMEVSQKLWKEREQQNLMKAAKIETEFDATMKAISAENTKCTKQLESLESEGKTIEKERKQLEKEKSNLEEDRQQVWDMAATIKQRSQEIEALCASAQKVREEGELALAKSNKQDLEHKQRWKDLLHQMDALTEQEKELAQERINLSQERCSLEALHRNQLCAHCRSPVSGAKVGSGVQGGERTSTKLGVTYSPISSLKPSGRSQKENYPVQISDDSYPLIQDTLDTIRTDQWLRQWKIRSLKDQEFLLGENLYLATLEKSQYIADSTSTF